MRISGKAVKLGDNVDTDVILPGKFLVFTDPEELGKHVMGGLDPEFPRKVRDDAIVVGGKNFGCGSSREQAPIALKAAGVRGIVAESFARIFYRNAINVGLPILECQGIHSKTREGDELTVDLEEGTIKNQSTNLILQATPLPEFILDLINEGGLIEHLRKQRKAK